MTAQNRTVLKAYFETGDRPTQGQFADTIDSFLSLTDTAAQTVKSNVAVSGAFTGHGGGTLHNFTINVPTVSAGTFTSPLINNSTINNPTITTPTVSAGTFASPIMTTPTLGAASATSLAFSSTSGIIGSTTNDNAAAGSVGQLVESVVTFASPTTGFSTGVAKNITSISLTAGDWDVMAQFGSVPAAGTTTTEVIGSISLTSDTLDAGEYQSRQDGLSLAAGRISGGTLARRRISIASTTTVYLVARFAFAVSTMGGSGFINARRIR